MPSARCRRRGACGTCWCRGGARRSKVGLTTQTAPRGEGAGRRQQGLEATGGRGKREKMLGAWLSIQLPVGALAMRLSRGELDEPSLVQAVQAGEAAAITRALDLCLPLLRRVASGKFGLVADEIEDVLQETRLAFWRAARQFRGECSLRTFLIQIASRQCSLYLRAKMRRSWEPLEEDPAAAGAELEVTVDRLAVEGALAQLSPRQRQVVELY